MIEQETRNFTFLIVLLLSNDFPLKLLKQLLDQAETFFLTAFISYLLDMTFTLQVLDDDY